MHRFGETFAGMRAANAGALSVFGARHPEAPEGPACRPIHAGVANGIVVYTVGYERRSSDELMGTLGQLGVNVLLDVRHKPISRKPGFHASSLRAACEEHGITYESWPELGSTPAQRRKLQETHDIDGFRRCFRAFAKRYRSEAITRLVEAVQSRKTALLCYERAHEDCHRSVLADLVSEWSGAAVVAIC